MNEVLITMQPTALVISGKQHLAKDMVDFLSGTIAAVTEKSPKDLQMPNRR